LGGDDTADTQHKGKRASPLGLGFIQSGSLTKALEILYGLSGNLIITHHQSASDCCPDNRSHSLSHPNLSIRLINPPQSLNNKKIRPTHILLLVFGHVVGHEKTPTIIYQYSFFRFLGIGFHLRPFTFSIWHSPFPPKSPLTKNIQLKPQFTMMFPLKPPFTNDFLGKTSICIFPLKP
jgi:hypothetical protein